MLHSAWIEAEENEGVAAQNTVNFIASPFPTLLGDLSFTCDAPVGASRVQARALCGTRSN